MINRSFYVSSEEGKAIIHAVRRLQMGSSGDACLTMRNETGGTKNFDSKTKRTSDMFSGDISKFLMKRPAFESIRRFSIVDTKIVAGRYKGAWIRAKVLQVYENKMDIQVLSPRKWNVVPIALEVPKKLIRPVIENDLENFTIPVEFTLDDSVLYISCSSKMKVEDLVWTIHLARGFPLDQIYILHHQKWLTSFDSIPNCRIFCIIHSGKPLAPNLSNLVSRIKRARRNSVSISCSELPSAETLGRFSFSMS